VGEAHPCPALKTEEMEEVVMFDSRKKMQTMVKDRRA